MQKLKSIDELSSPYPPDYVLQLTLWATYNSTNLAFLIEKVQDIKEQAQQIHFQSGYPYILCISKVCMYSGLFSCWQDGLFIERQPSEQDIESESWQTCCNAISEVFSLATNTY